MQGAARSSNNRQAVGEQQVSSRWAAGEQQQVNSSRWAAAASSSMEQQAAGKQQVSSSWAAGEQQQVSSSKQQQVAGKQQGSSRQAAGKQCPLERMIKYIFFNHAIKWTFSRRTAPKQWNCSLLKVVVMPNLNFFQAHGLPIRLLQADTT